MAYPVALAASWLVFFLISLYYTRSKYCSAFHPLSFFLLYHFVLFVLRPTLVYVYDYSLIYDAYQFVPSLSDKLIVIGAVNLSLIVFAITSLSFGNVSYLHISKMPRITSERRNYLSPLILAWVILGPVAVYSLFYTLKWQTSDTFDMIFDKEAGTYINTKGNGYAVDAQIMLVPLVVALAWIGKFNWKYMLPLVAFVIVKSFTGSRYPIVVAMFAVILLYFYDKKIRWMKFLFIGPLIGFWAIFNLMSLDRGAYFREIAGLSNGQTSGSVRQGSAPRFLDSMDYGNLEFFELIVYAVPQRTGSYDYFAENLQVVTEPIPRILWKDKPKGAPIKFFNLEDYIRFFSFTKSVAGAGWFALGWIGVAVWSWLFGAAYGLAYARWARSGSVVATLSYIMILALAIQLFRDGILLSVVKMGGFMLIPVLMTAFLKKFFAPGDRYGQPSSRRRSANRLASPTTLPAAVARRRAALAAAAPHKA